MRKFLADTVAMITFSWVIGMVIEMGIAGLTLGQSLQSRISGVAANLLTGGLYGKFRDWLFTVTKTTNESGWLREMFVGTLAFVSFQVPLYTAILWSTGATIGQIGAAVGTVTVLSTFIGGPYDMFLVLVRHLFQIEETP